MKKDYFNLTKNGKFTIIIIIMQRSIDDYSSFVHSFWMIIMMILVTNNEQTFNYNHFDWRFQARSSIIWWRKFSRKTSIKCLRRRKTPKNILSQPKTQVKWEKNDSELEVIKRKNLKSVIININERKKVKYHYHLSFFFPI